MAEETREYVPIYYDSPEKAYRESVTSPEADAFRASFSATEKCVNDIQAAIVQNRESTGKFSSTDFIEGLLDRHGKDRVEYVLASYIRSKENETPYFSDEVKKWAHRIRISDSYMIANTIIVAGGDDMVNALADEMRKRDLYEEKEADASEEGNAEKGYNIETSEKDTAENPTNVDMPEDVANKDVTKNDDGSVTVRMPEGAVIRRYQTSAVLCMPRNRGYDMFRYMVDIKCFRENGDGTVSVTMGTNDANTLTIRRRGQEVKLPADKLYDAFSGAVKEDYVPKKYAVEIPADAVQGNYPNMIRCRFPDDSVYQGQHVVIPAIFKDETKSDDTKVVFSIPDYMNFSVRNKDGDDMLIPVSDVAREVNSGTYRKKTRWTHVTLPQEALLHVYDKHSLLKMPETGSHKGFVYYLPNGMAPVDKDGSIKVRVPEERLIEVRNGQTGEKQNLTALEWANLVEGKTAADFIVKRDDRVYAGDREFLDRAEKIRSVMPDEMLGEASWIPVRVRDNKLDKDGEGLFHSHKYAVAPDTRFSADEAGYKNIGTDFDKAVEAGVSAGASTMGFCFSKESDVVCLELDRCLDRDGTPKTEKAKDIIENLDGTYMEKSVSGQGMHVFGKMSDPKIETLSRDSEVEVFSSCGYVAVTGDVVKSPKCLAPLDEGYAKEFLEENFDGANGIPDLTESDKKVLDRAFGGVNGDEFAALYDGENVRAGKDFNDMSLAIRFANVSGGDVKSVVRLYGASKRELKDPEYVSHLAKRATDGATEYMDAARRAADEGRKMREEAAGKKKKTKDEGPAM